MLQSAIGAHNRGFAESFPGRLPASVASSEAARGRALSPVLIFGIMRHSKLQNAFCSDALAALLSVLSLLTACSSDGAGGTAVAASGASSGGAAGSGTTDASGAANFDQSPAGASGTAGAAGKSAAGNPDGSCSTGIPASGQPADSTSPTTVVGTGSEASCTFDALKSAIAQGGVITFDCGQAPVTLAVTATLNLPTNKNTVIDGGNKITLDGGKAVQILRFDSANFQANESVLTLQHITLRNGKAT